MSGATAGYFERVQSTVPGNIQRLQQTFRSRGLPVIFLAVGRLGLNLRGERVTPSVNHPSRQIDDRVAPLPGEMVLNKVSSGVLSSTKLYQTLHNAGINSLVVCGLTTAVD